MVTVYFATNRDPNDYQTPTDFGKDFSRSGLTDLRFGKAQVTGRKLDRYKLTVAPENLQVPLAAAQRNDLSGQVLGSTAIFQEVRKRMVTKKCDLMVSIHGFNYSFKEALNRTAQLTKFYGDRDMVWFLFSWPSNGSMLPFKAYASDRSDARASGEALGRGLMKLAHFLRGIPPQQYCGQKLHIMAHSMGNYALRHAVQAIRASGRQPMRRLFEEVVLMAPDEDEDAFELDHKLKPLPEMAARVSIYCNPRDRALMISDFTKGNPDRLGAAGPRNAKVLPDKVSVVNVKRAVADDDDIQCHQYYKENKQVRDDVLALLDGKDPDELKTRVYNPEKNIYWLKK